MNETETTRLLHELAARIPVSPVPIGDLSNSEIATSRRRRNRLVVAGTAAATALVVTAGIVLQQALDDRSSQRISDASEPASQENMPVAPAGFRLVGLGRVVVTVPDSWATEIGGCENVALKDRVYFPGEVGLYCSTNEPIASSVQFYNDPSRYVPGLVADAKPAGELDGWPVSRIETKPSGDAEADGSLLLPQQHVLVQVLSPNASTVDHILESVALLPDGYVAIPSTQGPWQATRDMMVDAGLDVTVTEMSQESALHSQLLKTEPSLGSVVADGSSVTMVLNRASDGSTSTSANATPPMSGRGAPK